MYSGTFLTGNLILYLQCRITCLHYSIRILIIRDTVVRRTRMPPCPGFIPVRHQFNIPVYYSRAVGRGTFDGTAARKSMYSVRQRSVFAQRQINERTPVLVLHCRPLSFSVWHLSSLVHAVQLGAHLALIFLCEVFFPIFWLLITKYSLNFHTDIDHIGRKRRGF